MGRFRTAPGDETGLPPGVKNIIGNEAAERFSYYGMRSILMVYISTLLVGAGNSLAPMGAEEAKSVYHLFGTLAYLMPLVGALLADVFIGKYRTIIVLSLVYCLGHVALAIDGTRNGLYAGLALIAIGAGGIKPCVSAHVGDQFGPNNKRLMPRVYEAFYFAINLGAAASSVLTPILLERFGAPVAFGVPGVLMALATIVFYAGRHKFVHVPPVGRELLRVALSRAGLRALGRLSAVYVFAAVFWALYEQTGSSWVLQANSMDGMVFGWRVLPSQVQAANPLLILLLIPLFSRWIYPRLGRVVDLTPLRKMAVGFFVTSLAFAIPAWLQMRIDAGEQPSIAWQALCYLVMTSAEILISITCLEFSYTEAPEGMKSIAMSIFLLSVSLGNLFTAAVNHFIQGPDGTSLLPGASYFWFFAGVMLMTATLFLWYMRFLDRQSSRSSRGAVLAAEASAQSL